MQSTLCLLGKSRLSQPCFVFIKVIIIISREHED